MHDADKNNYFYLNREGQWPGFNLDGLELRPDGALQLASVPLLTAGLPDEVKSAPIPTGPAGLAMDETGTLYFSDPQGNRLLRIEGCDGCLDQVPCTGGTGDWPSQLHVPRGLLISKNRRALFVADSANNRIQIFDLDTFQLVEILGQPAISAPAQAGSLPGQFNTPWTLSGDSKGNVYVVDYGNKRVQKFNAVGDLIPCFCDQVQKSGSLKQPTDIAVLERSGLTWIFVLDVPSTTPPTPPTIFVFDAEGKPVRGPNGHPLSLQDDHLKQPMGLAVAGNDLYVGDNTSRRIYRFQIKDQFAFVGAAIGYDGPIAALLLDAKSALWVHSGLSIAPVKLEAQSGFRTQGVFSGKAIQIPDRAVVWHRLRALLSPLAANAHLELFAHASSDFADKPNVALGTDNPFSDPRWIPMLSPGHSDVTDLYIGGEAASFLWIGALFSGDGTGTPVLNQLLLEFDHPTYDQYLPAVYRNTEDCGEFLVRLLSLFEALFADVEGEIASLPALFDPRAVPKGFLPWLAGCLGFDLDDNWNEEKQRRLIGEIFRLYGWRGTSSGLREILRLFAGVDATIEEPLQHAAWWALPGTAVSCCDACAADSSGSSSSWQDTGNSILGWTTMLAPAQPQGAVVSTSAVLDQSHLITVDEFGSPLFTDVAYQFSVMVFRGQVQCADSLTRIRAILDQEKPAHTAYHLCIVEPRMRVGFQCRLGIDTVVGGPGRSLSLGSDQILGQDTVLAGSAETRLGAGSRLGVTTRLS